MSFPATTVLEVRTGGSDTNGGGFNAARGGVDYTLFNAVQKTDTFNLTANGTSAVTSSGSGWNANMVGNLVFLTGGGVTSPGWYEITAISISSQATITLDRSPSTATVTGGTINMGGALATPAAAIALLSVKGMTAWIKSGVYSIGTGLTFPSGPNFDAKTRVIGYGTTRGDGTKATLRATAGIAIITVGQSGIHLESLDIDGNSVASTAGLSVTANYNAFIDLKVRNCTANGVLFGSGSGNDHSLRMEVTGCSGAAAVSYTAGTIHTFEDGWVHDNTVSGMDLGSNQSADCNLIGTLVTNNTGGSSDGVIMSYSSLVRGCTIHGNGRDGVRMNVNYINLQPGVRNCILSSNGGYGINMTSAPAAGPVIVPEFDYNAFYNNTSGARNTIGAGTHDVTLSGSPFTNAAGNDFSLNNTAGAGAACRAVGYPGTLPGGTTVGYQDIGAAQHQDSGGGTAGIVGGPIIARPTAAIYY